MERNGLFAFVLTLCTKAKHLIMGNFRENVIFFLNTFNLNSNELNKMWLYKDANNCIRIHSITNNHADLLINGICLCFTRFHDFSFGRFFATLLLYYYLPVHRTALKVY